MTNILDLPNELLCEIIGHLQFKRSLLGCLARLNHRFHDLSQPFLWRYANNISNQQKSLLKRTLKEKPDLKRGIWWYGPIDTRIDGRIEAEDFYDIPELMNLKKLQFKVVRFLVTDHQSCQRLSQWDVLGQVEEVELSAVQSLWTHFPGGLIKLFAELPLVHTLAVTNILTGLPHNGISLTAGRWQERRSDSVNHILPNLRTLKLSGIKNTILARRRAGTGMREFNASDLKEILLLYTNLTTLHCTDLFLTIYGTGHLVALADPLFRFPGIEPAAIQNALRDVEAQLQELVLTGKGDEKTIYVGPPMDLSTFTCLNKLHISSAFIMERDGAENTLHNRLPPNISVLRLDFGPALSVLQAPEGLGGDDHEPTSRFHYEWLLLFPVHKTSHFPKLREIKMVEERPKSSHKVIKWELPVELAQTFEDAGIDMDIQLCRHLVGKPEWISTTWRLTR